MSNPSNVPTSETEAQDARSGSAAEPSKVAGSDNGTRWGPGRWAIMAVVVLLLVVYPAARWMLSRSGGAEPLPRAGEAELQAALRSYQAGRFEDAITAAKAALAANPNSANAYNTMAVSYMGLHRVDEAIQAAQTAIRLQPDFQLARNNLAWFQQENAKAAAQPVAPGTADQMGALLNLSQQQAQTGRFKECIDTATQAVKLDPGSARAFNNIGFCAANLKQWDEAIRNTQEAIRLDPSLQLAKNNLAWMQQEKLKADQGTGK